MNGRLHPLRSSEDVVAVHQASLDLLENGILVKSEAAQEIFHGHGCSVEKNRGLVKIPAHVAESAIQSVPDRFLLAGRTPGMSSYSRNGTRKGLFIHGAYPNPFQGTDFLRTDRSFPF